jgi:methionyl-tRNA formyltransferase
MYVPPPDPASIRLVFMGSPEFAQPSLRRLIDSGYAIVGVYTQPDRSGGRGRKLLAQPVKRLAEENGLPVFQPPSLRRPEAVAELAALHPDVIVVVAFGRILRPDVLSVPAKGVLNVHASLLPHYRGASPIAAALLDGKDETGVSIMLLDEGMDTGPVLAQRSEAILSQDTAGSLSERLAVLGAELLIATLPAWLAGQIEPQPQDESQATTTRLIAKADGVLDWSLSAAELWHRVRAYTPWPGAITTLDGAPLQILQAWPLEMAAGPEPGRIIAADSAWPVPPGLPRAAFAVGTGAGLLVPLTLQRAGRRPLEARDFANGERGLVGRRLGSRDISPFCQRLGEGEGEGEGSSPSGPPLAESA